MERTADSTSSTETTRSPAPAPEGVVLGRVVGAHGLRGELRVRMHGESIDNLRSAATLRIANEQGDPNTVEARVRAVRPGRAGEALLCLEGVDDRDAAEREIGKVVVVRAEDLERLAEGEYYQYELVGCRVEDGAGRFLGVVQGIWETGAPDVLIVEDGERQHLIPAVGAFLREVDLDSRRIVVDAPPGLIEAEPGR